MKINGSGQFLNIFKPDEVHLLAEALHKLKDDENIGTFKANTNGFRSTDLIYPFIKKKAIGKLEQLFNRPLSLDQGMLLKGKIPWKIHNDFTYGVSSPDLTILIPLNEQQINTHTVVFNEVCTSNFNDYKLKNAKLVTNAADIHGTLMSHVPSEDLEYVSLQGSYQWIPGSVIYWDRKLLHASDNFPKNNLTEKFALVLFTSHV